MKTDQYSPMLRQKIIVRNSNLFGSPTIQYQQTLNPGPSQFVSQFNKTPERIRMQQVTQIYPLIQNISTLLLPSNMDIPTNRKDTIQHTETYQTSQTNCNISPINSPQGKKKYMNSNPNEDSLFSKLTQTQQQLQILQAENEKLKQPSKNNQPENRFTSNKNSDSKKQSNQLQDAVQRMEIEKLRFELQSKDRCINFLEDRLRVEEEERMHINQMYSKRIDQEIHTNDHIAKLKEVNIILEKTIKQQKQEYASQMKEQNQKIVHLQQDISEKSQQLDAFQDKYDNIHNEDKSEEDIKYLQKIKEELQKEVEDLQNSNIQNEEYFVECNCEQMMKEIKLLTAENDQLQQSVVSFDDQRAYFQSELKQLQDYYYEITQENERLNDQKRVLPNSQEDKQNEINQLREQLIFLKTETDPSKIQKFALPSEQDFQTLEQQRSMTEQEIQQLADQYLNGDSDELDVNSLRELKKFLKYFRVHILEIYEEVKWLRQDKQLDSGALKDINEIKSYKPVSYPSKRSSEPSNEQEIRELQLKSDEVVGQIQLRKQYLENQDSEGFMNNSSNNDKVIEELEVLYQQHDTYQVQIQFLGEKMQVRIPLLRIQKQNIRRQSSVSFDQSFDMQNSDI